MQRWETMENVYQFILTLLYYYVIIMNWWLSTNMFTFDLGIQSQCLLHFLRCPKFLWLCSTNRGTVVSFQCLFHFFEEPFHILRTQFHNLRICSTNCGTVPQNVELFHFVSVFLDIAKLSTIVNAEETEAKRATLFIYCLRKGKYLVYPRFRFFKARKLTLTLSSTLTMDQLGFDTFKPRLEVKL